MSINVNDPWNRGDEPLGDLASAIDVCKKSNKQHVYIMRGTPFLAWIIEAFKGVEEIETVVVEKGSAIGASECVNVNVGTPGHIDVIMPGAIREVVIDCNFYINERRCMVPELDPVIKIPVNNKPWYQQTKGRRRSY